LLNENNGHKKVPEHRQRNKENNFIVNSLHLNYFFQTWAYHKNKVQIWGDYVINAIDCDYNYLPHVQLRLRINKIIM